MAKVVKQKTDIINEEISLVDETQTGITHPVSVPDIPAQMEEETPLAQIVHPSEEKESDEILFLRRVLHVQHSGGFGRHLDDLIYDRIKELKK